MNFRFILALDREARVRADIVCASASKVVRTRIGKNALLQLDATILAYASADKEKRLVLAYRARKLPYEAKNRGPRLKTLKT
jgi:hypothetical protein